MSLHAFIDADRYSLAQDGRGTNETFESGLLVKLRTRNCFRLCFMHHFWAESPYRVYNPHFKRCLLDPRIKCWQKPTLTHSVFYIAVKLQRDKT